MLCAAIDTETLDLRRATAVIVSVGITIFDLSDVQPFEHHVNAGINLYLDQEVQRQAGRTVLQSTWDWWMSQGDLAKKELNQPGYHPSIAKVMIDQYLSSIDVNKKHLKWYARGSHFDIAKMDDLFAQFDTPSPWHYRKPRDSRQFMEERGYDDNIKVRRPDSMVPHNSLHDAAFEAYMMQRAHNGVQMDIVV